MSQRIIAFFLILTLVSVFPQVNAQSDSIEEVNQKLIQITIGQEGDMRVVHQISDSDKPKILNFVSGDVSNLIFIDQFASREPIKISEGDTSIVILPDQGELFVQYDLDNVMILKDNVWTLDFRYLHTTNFYLPDEAELIFVNKSPIYLDDKKGFACHGCQMVLEYSINEASNMEQVKWEDKEFLVEIKTHSEIKGFNFNQPEKKISFDVNNENQFVKVIIPLELLWEPYTVFLDNEMIDFHEYNSNGTHVWLNMKPGTTGQVTILGTTVVPEFSVIGPLVGGFLMILVIPIMKRLISSRAT